jgi:hypothetical protein
MRKLKLESLQVESFATAPAPRERGTMHAHQQHVPFETYDIEVCGDTRYFDCTFGCTVDTGCCTVETQGADCVPA